MPWGRSDDDGLEGSGRPAARSEEGSAAGPLLSRPAAPRIHRVARFHRIPAQQAEEWCWAAVCLGLLQWRGVPTTLCEVVRKVRGGECARSGPGCLHRACRQPESLARALGVLGIPFRRIPSVRRWQGALEALQDDQLVVCEIPFEGSSHAVLLSSAALATEREAAWLGVDDPLPFGDERRIVRFYQAGFRPTFAAAVGAKP